MQNYFVTELKKFDKSIKTIEKRSFLSNLGLFFSSREKVLNNFRSKLIPIRILDKIPIREATFESAFEPAPEISKATKVKTKQEISPLKLRKDFLSKIN